MNEREAAPTLILASEAARRLAISTRTFWKLVERGDLCVIRVAPRRVAVDEADLIAYVSSRREGASARRAAGRAGRSEGTAPRDDSLQSR